MNTLQNNIFQRLIELNINEELEPLMFQLQAETKTQIQELIDLNLITQNKLDNVSQINQQLEQQYQSLLSQSNPLQSLQMNSPIIKKKNIFRSSSIKSTRKIQDKENQDLNRFKQTVQENEIQIQVEREETYLIVIRKLQQQHVTKIDQLSLALNEMNQQVVQNSETHKKDIADLLIELEEKDLQNSKYRTCMSLLMPQLMTEEISKLVQDVKQFIEPLPSITDSQIVRVINNCYENVESCNLVVTQLLNVLNETHIIIAEKQEQNQRQDQQIEQMSKMINKLNKSNEDLNFQVEQLREIQSQSNQDDPGLKRKINLMEGELNKLKYDQVHSTQLFSKALDDLERVQGDNEHLEAMLSPNPKKGHLLTSQYKNYFEKCYQGTRSQTISQSIRGNSVLGSPRGGAQSLKSSYSNPKSPKYHQFDQLDQLGEVLELLLKEGFDSLQLQIKMKKIVFTPGQFKMQLLWERLRTILTIFDSHMNQTQASLQLVDDFIGQVQTLVEGSQDENRPRFSHHISSLHALCLKENQRFDDIGLTLSSILKSVHNLKVKGDIRDCLLEHNRQKDINLNFQTQRLSQEINETTNSNEYHQKVIQEIFRVATKLISISSQRDQGVMNSLENLISHQKVEQKSEIIITKYQKNVKRLIRNTQNSTSKILMNVFKTYKQDFLTLTEILYSLAKGWKHVSQGQKESYKQKALSQMIEDIEHGLADINNGQLGTLIAQELNTLCSLRI